MKMKKKNGGQLFDQRNKATVQVRRLPICTLANLDQMSKKEKLNFVSSHVPKEKNISQMLSFTIISTHVE